MKQFFKAMRFMFQYSWGMSKKIFFTTGLNVILDVVQPIVTVLIPKYIIDSLTVSKDWGAVLMYIYIYIFLLIALKTVKLLSDAMINGEYNIIQSKTGAEYCGYSLKMPYAHLEDQKVQNLAREIRSNVRCSNFIGSDFSGFLTSFFILLSFSFVLLQLDIWFFLVILLSAAVNYFITQKREKNGCDWQKQEVSYESLFSWFNHVMFTLPFGKEVRINHLHQWANEFYIQQAKSYADQLKKQTVRESKSVYCGILNIFIRNMFIYLYGAWRVIYSSLSLGSFYVYVGAITNISDALNNIIEKVNMFITLSKYVERYGEFKAFSKPQNGSVMLPEMEKDACSIEFQNVSFCYPNTKSYILKDVSFKINKGEKLAVIGENGAGKSTIVKLLCKLYKPEEGKILLNGIDIWNIDITSFAKSVSVNYQDFEMFSMSIRENIQLNQIYDEAKYKYAIKLSGMENKVNALPNGDKTILYREFDDHGVDFSGGEVQKIALARSIYKDANLMLLDEPSSALDPKAESELYESLNEMTSGKSAIYISHRLSSVLFCDYIIVLKNGSVTESGTHDDLMINPSLYAQMYTTQAQYYRQK